LSELLNPEHPPDALAERIEWSQFNAVIDARYADELVAVGQHATYGRPLVPGT
jgi:hypothetical protein